VKVRVQLSRFVRVGGAERVDEAGQHVLDRGQHLGGHALGAHAGEMGLEHEADVVEQPGLVGGEPVGDERAAAAVGDDEPFALEHAQSLAHGGAADAGPLHDDGLGEACAGGLAAGQDVVADDAADMLGQRGWPFGTSVAVVVATAQGIPVRAPRSTASGDRHEAAVEVQEGRE
jgi:hypothetical protein